MQKKITGLTLALLTTLSLSTAALAQDQDASQSTPVADSGEPNSANDFSQVLLALGGPAALPTNFADISSPEYVKIVPVTGVMNFDRAALDAAVASNQANIDQLRAQLATNAVVTGLVDVNTVVGSTVNTDGELVLYVDNGMAASVPMQDQTTTGSVSTGSDAMTPDPYLDQHSGEPGTQFGNGASEPEPN